MTIPRSRRVVPASLLGPAATSPQPTEPGRLRRYGSFVAMAVAGLLAGGALVGVVGANAASTGTTGTGSSQPAGPGTTGDRGTGALPPGHDGDGDGHRHGGMGLPPGMDSSGGGTGAVPQGPGEVHGSTGASGSPG